MKTCYCPRSARVPLIMGKYQPIKILHKLKFVSTVSINISICVSNILHITGKHKTHILSIPHSSYAQNTHHKHKTLIISTKYSS